MTIATNPVNESLSDLTIVTSIKRSTTSRKTIDDVPTDLLIEWSAKLYALINLSWSYIDTICDICVQARIDGTKKLVRYVRKLKCDYDKFRSPIVDSSFVDKDSIRAQEFEESFSADFTRLFYALSNEVSKFNLSGEHKTLAIAVLQALTIVDAVKKYAAQCDRKIRKLGVKLADFCLIQNDVLKVFSLIPLFANKYFDTDIHARKQTAQILVNRLNECQLCITKQYI